MCFLNGAVSQVSDVTHGSFVNIGMGFFKIRDVIF